MRVIGKVRGPVTPWHPPTLALAPEMLHEEQPGDAAKRNPQSRPGATTINGERGAVAVVVAILLVVVLGFVGLGVDIGFWYYQGWRQQQAADQAALAGAVFLPGDPAQAKAIARQFAALNGYDADVTTTNGTASKTNQLTVSLSRDYNGFFSNILGKKFQNIYRTSSAEFVPPLAIGSPFARAGNDPENATGGNFNYWLNQHGPWVAKHQGDRYASDICDADLTVVHKTPYGCVASTQTRGKNVDYERIGKFGYRYSVDVNAVQAGKDLVFEVFDGITTDVGSTCNTSKLPTATQRQALSRWVPDADVRYRSGSEPTGVNWCAADDINFSGNAARNTQYMDTEFAVFAPTRSVAAGALVQNTTPPTTIAPAITTTTLPGGGGTIAGLCSPATTTGATTLTVNNDRATSLKGYLVSPSCLETLVFASPPASNAVLNSFAGYRYRFYDASSGAFVSEYTVPTPAPGLSPTISLAAHLESPGPCAVGGGNATLTVTNQRSMSVGIYSMGANCRETFLYEVPAGGTQSVAGLTVGQSIRFYEPSTNRLAQSYVMPNASPVYTVTAAGPAATCSPSPAAAATINFVNQRPDPIRVYSVDSSCNLTAEQTVASGWTATTNAGTIWQVVDTYTGAVLRTFSAIAGAQTISELPRVLTSGNCSTTSGANSTLQVVNDRSTTLTIKSVGADCLEVLQSTIAPNATAVMSAFIGQRWKVYDGADQAGDITLVNVGETLTIAAPNSWVWDPNAGSTTNGGTVVLCSRIETSYPLTSYSSLDQHTGTVSELINPADGVHDNGSGTRDTFAENFATGFRRWRQFCKIPAASVAVGRYTITTKTNLNDQSAGTNSFSLRAQWRGALPADTSETGLQLSAVENFPVFINLGGANTSTLYMTRLNPVHAGRTMRLELFDIGDIGTPGGTLNFQVLPPTSSNVGSSWPCSMKLVSADGTFAPAGFNAANCSITGLSRQIYNGTAIQIDIPIPQNFTCSLVLPTDCWTAVKLTFNNGARPTDRTTWSASVLGDPLRLLR